eukprot:364260-Chlamydomonas_euryale.AAC.5
MRKEQGLDLCDQSMWPGRDKVELRVASMSLHAAVQPLLNTASMPGSLKPIRRLITTARSSPD